MAWGLIRWDNRKAQKYYHKRALIHMNNYRQDKYQRKTSNAYQNFRFVKYGSETCLIKSLLALAETTEQFNCTHELQLHNKHALLLCMIKLYCIDNDTRQFSARAIFEYYPNLDVFFGWFVDKEHKSFAILFRELNDLWFIKLEGEHYVTTARMNVFTSLFDKSCKKLFVSKE